MAKPPHEVLGVPENATRAEIDEAYRTRLIYANPKSFAEGTPEREKARAHCEELMRAYYVLCSKPTTPHSEVGVTHHARQVAHQVAHFDSLLSTGRPSVPHYRSICSIHGFLRFLNLLSNVIFLTSPLVFAWGVNKNTLLLALYVIISLTAMQVYFKPGANFLIDILWAVALGVVGGTLFSTAFGFFIFGLCAGSPIYDGIKNPINTSMLVRVFGGPLLIAALAIGFAAYFYALYQGLAGSY